MVGMYIAEVVAGGQTLLDEAALHLGVHYTGHAYETIRDTVLAILALAAVDLAGVRLSGARYYILHAFINAGVVYAVANDFYELATDPMGASIEITHNPLPLVYAIHLYHVLFFNDLTFIDWAHHFINVLVMGVIAECWNWGKGVNATCFFMNGVPGGIDYVLLTLVKHGLMDSMTEKKLNTGLNQMIRLPGMTIVAYIMFVTKWNGILHNPWIVLFLILVLEWGNAVYFATRVTGNYYVRSHVMASRQSKTATNGQAKGSAAENDQEEEEEFH